MEEQEKIIENLMLSWMEFELNWEHQIVKGEDE